MSDFEIGINDYKSIGKGYTLKINGRIVRGDIENLENVIKEIKKYLRLRFKENLR